VDIHFCGIRPAIPGQVNGGKRIFRGIVGSSPVGNDFGYWKGEIMGTVIRVIRQRKCSMAIQVIQQDKNTKYTLPLAIDLAKKG
jgi:hypothetical protein